MLTPWLAAGLISFALGAGAEVSSAAAPLPGAEPAPTGAVSPGWPLPALPHPLALANREKSPKKLVAAVQGLPPEERAKAIHDWVVLTLRYSLEAHDQQGPDEVFARKTATCDGYAGLFQAAAASAGLEVETIRGLLKVPQGPPQPHAWNAVKLRNRWWLVDVTLDDPTLRGDGVPDASFRTDYLLMPAAIAAIDHWPYDARWQLEAPRPTRQAFSGGGRLDAPSLLRARIRVVQGPQRRDGRVTVRLEAPGDRFLFLALDGRPCSTPALGPHLELSCPLPDAGAPRLELLEHAEGTGLFLSIFEFSPGW